MLSTFATITLLFRLSFEDPCLMHNDNGGTSFCKHFCVFVGDIWIDCPDFCLWRRSSKMRFALMCCNFCYILLLNLLVGTCFSELRSGNHGQLRALDAGCYIQICVFAHWFQLLFTCLLKVERYRASKRIIWLCAWGPLGFYPSTNDNPWNFLWSQATSSHIFIS